MSDSNRVQLARVRETTLGTTPDTPRMRKARYTSAQLAYRPDFVMSDEIRDDGMNTDPIKVGESNGGTVGLEFSWPVDRHWISEDIVSVLRSDWVNTPTRDNDGTADSVITDVAETGGVYTVTSGAAFVAGQLVRCSGFGAAGNNGLKKITTGSATVPAVGGSAGVVDEAAPAAAARMKVVGFEGASGDLTALADGLGSTDLDFTTLGLAAGQWVKIGGTGSGYRFAVEALNGWARISGAPTATKLPLDNLPSGWATNDGSGKTLRVFFGDRIKNGVTKIGSTFERGYLDQQTPTYIAQRGMMTDEMSFSMAARQKVTATATYVGMGGGISATPLDATPDAAPEIADYPVMSAGANVARIAENGVVVGGPDFVKELGIRIKSNVRTKDAVGSLAPADLGIGSCDVTVTAQTYFGSDGLYAKLVGGVATNMNARAAKGGKAVIWGMPRLTPTEGNPDVGGKNQDVMLPLTLQASYDATTQAHILIDRLEYYED